MTVPEPLAPTTKAESHPAGHPPVSRLSRPQRQILRLLEHGDLLWEIADDAAHCAVYNEKRGGDQPVPAALVTTLERQGWIQKRPNPQADRLDSWEITSEGKAVLPRPKDRSRSGEPSGIPSNE